MLIEAKCAAARKVDFEFVVASCYESELFERIKESFDKVEFPVKKKICFPLYRPVSFARDNHCEAIPPHLPLPQKLGKTISAASQKVQLSCDTVRAQLTTHRRSDKLFSIWITRILSIRNAKIK
jgi:hypothetical protein